MVILYQNIFFDASIAQIVALFLTYTYTHITAFFHKMIGIFVLHYGQILAIVKTFLICGKRWLYYGVYNNIIVTISTVL